MYQTMAFGRTKDSQGSGIPAVYECMLHLTNWSFADPLTIPTLTASAICRWLRANLAWHTPLDEHATTR